MKQKNQNKRAFSEQIKRHQGIIHRVTLVYADNRADREDLFQEICFQLWRSYPNFREESRFTTWMYRVALNTAISQIRKNKKNLLNEPLEGVDMASDGPTGREEEVRLLYRAISSLNRIEKAIILLWLEEKSYDEIASITGISKSNVSVKLVRIKKKLEEMVNQIERVES